MSNYTSVITRKIYNWFSITTDKKSLSSIMDLKNKEWKKGYKQAMKEVFRILEAHDKLMIKAYKKRGSI